MSPFRIAQPSRAAQTERVMALVECTSIESATDALLKLHDTPFPEGGREHSDTRSRTRVRARTHTYAQAHEHTHTRACALTFYLRDRISFLHILFDAVSHSAALRISFTKSTIRAGS
jgi:hypothetical protein